MRHNWGDKDLQIELIARIIRLSNMNAYDANIISENVSVEEKQEKDEQDQIDFIMKEENVRDELMYDSDNEIREITSSALYRELYIQMQEELNAGNAILVSKEEKAWHNQIIAEEKFYFKQLAYLHSMYNIFSEYYEKKSWPILGEPKYINQKYDDSEDLVLSIFPQRIVFQNGLIHTIEEDSREQIQNEENAEWDKLVSEIENYYNSISKQIMNHMFQSHSDEIDKLKKQNEELNIKLTKYQQTTIDTNMALEAKIKRLFEE